MHQCVLSSQTWILFTAPQSLTHFALAPSKMLPPTCGASGEMWSFGAVCLVMVVRININGQTLIRPSENFRQFSNESNDLWVKSFDRVLTILFVFCTTPSQNILTLYKFVIIFVSPTSTCWRVYHAQRVSQYVRRQRITFSNWTIRNPKVSFFSGSVRPSNFVSPENPRWIGWSRCTVHVHSAQTWW